eukprot:9421038-Ditylum_brightwellii.AAC.1
MMVLSYIQIVSDSGLSLLSKIKTDRSYVPALWLCHIRAFLYSCKGHVFIPDAWCLKPQCLHNQFIMDCFEGRKLSADSLENLNAMCLYLGVLMITDITNDEGTHIMP